MKTFFHLFFALFTIINLHAQEWTVIEIGTTPNDKAYSVWVGKGHNDGVNRIYVTTRGEATDGGIYEYTFDGTNWSMTGTVGTGLRNLVTITLGDGRNDGVIRMYAVEWGSTLSNFYEYTWNGSSWDRVTIASPGKPMASVMVADSRGDGVNRVVVGGYIIQREYTWNGTGWDAIDISTTHGSEGPAIFGDGRNEGITRYYAPGNHVKEFNWGGAAWSETGALSAPSGWAEAVAVSDARNDGTNRVYYQDANGQFEMTWDGAAWQSQSIGTRVGRSYLYTAKTKSDGKNYLYNTDIASPFREMRYNSTISSYEYTDIDAATGATGLVDAGNGRNDNVVRIYIPGYTNGKVYEITNENPFVLTIPPVVSGENMLCPGQTTVLGTGIYDSYQWYRRYYGSGVTDPIPGATSQTLTIDYNDYAASYVTVEVVFHGESFISDEFFIDGWAFMSPTVMSTGDFTVGGSGESVLCEGDTMYFTLMDPYNTNIIWTLNGTTIPGENGQVLEVTEEGDYYVTGAPAECPGYIQGPGVVLTVVYCDPSSVSETDDFKIKVYPNPAKELIKIDCNLNLDGKTWVITDFTGKKVALDVLDNQHNIDVSALPAGMYILKINMGTPVQFKIVKD